MDFNETLDYLYQRLPMFQRVGPVAFKKDLTNTLRLCAVLGNPQEQFSSIHIAGTNGKGSVSHILASVLQESGLKVGLYTSPHLRSFTERIRINGDPIPEAAVVEFVESNQSVIEHIQPSFFEVTVAMAFDHFRNQKVDVAVVEVGLGGRLDSTNIIQPILGAITNISFDHTDLLGDTLALIAGEKAGIIKPGISFVIGEAVEETRPVFEAKASQEGANLIFAQEVYALSCWKQGIDSQKIGFHKYMEPPRCFHLGLGGDYQYHNVRTVLCLIDALLGLGFKITEAQISKGLKDVVPNTGFRGRMTILDRDPLVLVDTGHNLAGVKEVLKAFDRIDFENIHLVWGTVSDKDPLPILKLLPRHGNYYFVRPDVPRGKDARELTLLANGVGLQGVAWPSVEAGLAAAREAAGPNDLIFVGGSTFVVAEVV